MMKKYSFLLLLTLFVSQFMAQNVPSYVPTNGLVGWWPFNGNANDESGNGNNGTVNGATLSVDRNGKANSAYSFDGYNDYLSIKKSNPLNINSNMTISIWFNIENWDKTFNSWAPFISKSTSPLICNYRIAINKEIVSFIYKGVDYYFKYDPNILKLNVWNHIVVLFQNNVINIYINNFKITKEYTSSPFPDGESMDLELGRDQPGTVDYFFGQLDDIAIYNRALSDQEVKQLYQGCSSETATSTSFNSVLFTTGNTVALSAVPQGGVFKGASVVNNQFVPSNAKIGVNKVQYSFKNSQGCNDSTLFKMIVADTVGNTCKIYDTITVKNNIYDTITVKNNVYDTILKLKFKLTTGINANQMTSMTLYPNPTTDVLYIEIGDAKALDGYRYRIIDAVGKEVYNQLVKNPKTEIPLRSLGAAGMYLFEVIDQQNKTIQSNKIVLE